MRKLLESNLYIFKENLKLILVNAVDQVWNVRTQQDKLDNFILKEMHRGSFAEITEVDEDNYRSNMVSKKSLEGLNFDPRASDVRVLGADEHTNKKLSKHAAGEEKKDMTMALGHTDKLRKHGREDDLVATKNSNRAKFKEAVDLNFRELSPEPREGASSRSQTYISLSPSHRHSFNDSVKDHSKRKSIGPRVNRDDLLPSPFCSADKNKSGLENNRSHLSKFADYKHNGSIANANANNHINININISNDKNKLSVKRSSLQANPSNVSYKPIIDEIKRRRNFTAKDKINKSMSLNSQSTTGFVTNFDPKKFRELGRFSIDSKRASSFASKGP